MTNHEDMLIALDQVSQAVEVLQSQLVRLREQVLRVQPHPQLPGASDSPQSAVIRDKSAVIRDTDRSDVLH